MRLTTELSGQFTESKGLGDEIRKNLKGLRSMCGQRRESTKKKPDNNPVQLDGEIVQHLAAQTSILPQRVGEIVKQPVSQFGLRALLKL